MPDDIRSVAHCPPRIGVRMIEVARSGWSRSIAGPIHHPPSCGKGCFDKITTTKQDSFYFVPSMYLVKLLRGCLHVATVATTYERRAIDTEFELWTIMRSWTGYRLYVCMLISEPVIGGLWTLLNWLSNQIKSNQFIAQHNTIYKNSVTK